METPHMTNKPTTNRKRQLSDILQGKPSGQWHPEAVGLIPGYPATQERYDQVAEQLRANSAAARASGKATRKGVPNGFAGRREELHAIRAADLVRARGMVEATTGRPLMTDEEAAAALAASGKLTDQQYGDLALAHVVAVFISATYCATDRLSAARIALPYLTGRPTAASRKRPQDDGLQFLNDVAASMRTTSLHLTGSDERLPVRRDEPI
jgi:hypothetical protein